ncbi:MAG: ATP-binding protein [Actinomycetota bacterium]
MTVEIRRSLASDTEAARRARAALSELDGRLPLSVRQDLELLVSEVVTNAVRHARVPVDDPIDMTVLVEDDRIRAEIADPGPGFEPTAAAPTIFQAHGWGLFLVGQLSSRWGVDRASRGTTVWFEIDLAPRRKPA